MKQTNSANEEGLLFRLTGENGSTADYACGEAQPAFFSKVHIRQENDKPYFDCDDQQLMAYCAPGNIYAQRGTLVFNWRSRYPVGRTQFPIFRVAYSDHTSWDCVFLRIDYNGGGLDAFVTDVNLARTRVSVTLHPFPSPSEWMQIAFSWDERVGVKLYVNGILLESKHEQRVYCAGLDKFGPHSRIISPWSMQSLYNFMRGGDISQLSIYDRMLSDENVMQLYKKETLTALPSVERTLLCSEHRAEWLLLHGWNKARCQPVYDDTPKLSVKKVELHEAYDQKRWIYKCLDGIAETTWPGVFNRSRLPGRNDYFQLPDWDCYYNSGKGITFVMPQEPWNHLEISGSAFGSLSIMDKRLAGKETPLLQRPRYIQRTVHRLNAPIAGKALHFENVLIEEPISDFSVYYVTAGEYPQNAEKESYYIDANACLDSKAINEIKQFIAGRYPSDERALVSATSEQPKPLTVTTKQSLLPIVHIALEYKADIRHGLDGVVLNLPAMRFTPDEDGMACINIQICDPLWYQRRLANFSLKIKPNTAKQIWFDLRDRILPENKILYFILSCSAPEFGIHSLHGANIQLVYKPFELARIEHEQDRFCQIRELYGHMLEEKPSNPDFAMHRRFVGDLSDLLSVNPQHRLAQEYLYDFATDTMRNVKNDGSVFPLAVKPKVEIPNVPEGAAGWAFMQVEALKRVKHFLKWWIDESQTENGELGGGLSDDGDMTALWPGPAKMGCIPEKIRDSLYREMEAFYSQGMFIDGLPYIQTDYLHSFEEGIQALCQCLNLEPDNPHYFEHALETARALFRLIDFNKDGDRLFKTCYYNGTTIARDYPWNCTHPMSYLVTGPAIAVALYNGNPRLTQLFIDLADTLLRHIVDGEKRFLINFDTGDSVVSPNTTDSLWNIYAAANAFAPKRAYTEQFDFGARSAPGKSNPVTDEAAYQTNCELYEKFMLREYINTDGRPWTDRFILNFDELMRQRLGGIAHKRDFLFPLNVVEWRFKKPACDESLGILFYCAKPDELKFKVHSLVSFAVSAEVIGCQINPGNWLIHQYDGNGALIGCNETEFERLGSICFSFSAHSTNTIHMQLQNYGVPYYSRCDIAITNRDVRNLDDGAMLTVHNLGAVTSLPTIAVMRNKGGEAVATASIPSIPAPLDLYPKTADVFLAFPAQKGYSIELDPNNVLCEISRRNNKIVL